MHRPVLYALTRICAAPLLSVCALISSAMAQQAPVQLDSSDWWSYTRQEELPYQEPQPPIRFQKREPGESNFQIAGITLDATRHDFSEIRAKFGEGTEVGRGDGASGRNQICYMSASGKVHLIFEFGEVNSVVYLFEGGPTWNGSELCRSSKLVSEKTSTESGLRLGDGACASENHPRRSEYRDSEPARLLLRIQKEEHRRNTGGASKKESRDE